MPWIKTTPDGVILTLRIVPRASRNEIKEPVGDALKIRLQAPPVEGKANTALVRFLAKQLSIPPRSIQIKTGTTGRTKSIIVQGLTEQKIRAALS